MIRRKSKQPPLFSTLPLLAAEAAATPVAREDSVAGKDNQQEMGSCSLQAKGSKQNSSSPSQEHPCDPLAMVDFVCISPGTFWMGSPDEEVGRDSSETLHEVTLTKGFLLQATLVTQRQWKTVMGANPASFRTASLECPVEGVSWNDCQEFIKRCNARSSHKYRLPTEAEWEYACRAGTVTAFGHGDVVFGDDGRAPDLELIAWYNRNSGGKTHPVGQKAPNAWGLYDMHGNLCEWCEDLLGAYSSQPQRDPVATQTSSRRVGRGGCWVSPARNCRSASRFGWAPGYKSDFVGFRLVREIE